MHGDVFRPPNGASLLAVYVGTGAQLISMAVVTMIFAVLGFLSPANRGGLMTAVLLLFVFMGIFAGYSSARLYKMFKVRSCQAGCHVDALLGAGGVDTQVCCPDDWHACVRHSGGGSGKS